MENKQIDQLIIEIIKNGKIAKQAELLSKLYEKGLKVTQPNLSRRMERLQIKKEMGIYVLPIKADNVHKHIKDIIIAPPNLLLIHTIAGFEGSVAAEIDQVRYDKKSSIRNILGTIAGDDTVLVVGKNINGLKEIHQGLIRHFSCHLHISKKSN